MVFNGAPWWFQMVVGYPMGLFSGDVARKAERGGSLCRFDVLFSMSCMRLSVDVHMHVKSGPRSVSRLWLRPCDGVRLPSGSAGVRTIGTEHSIACVVRLCARDLRLYMYANVEYVQYRCTCKNL